MCNCKAKKNYNKDYKVNWCSVCFEVSEPKSYNKVIKRIFMGLFLFSLVFTFVDARCPKIDYITLYKPYIEKDIELNDSVIYNQLVKEGCYFPDIAIKQLRIECGNDINSYVCKENHNLFGIRCNCKYTNGYKNSHSNYKTYMDCIKCYVKFTNAYWDKYCNMYAEAPNYLDVIKKM